MAHGLKIASIALADKLQGLLGNERIRQIPIQSSTPPSPDPAFVLSKHLQSSQFLQRLFQTGLNVRRALPDERSQVPKPQANLNVNRAENQSYGTGGRIQIGQTDENNLQATVGLLANRSTETINGETTQKADFLAGGQVKSQLSATIETEEVTIQTQLNTEATIGVAGQASVISTEEGRTIGEADFLAGAKVETTAQVSAEFESGTIANKSTAYVQAGAVASGKTEIVNTPEQKGAFFEGSASLGTEAGVTNETTVTTEGGSNATVTTGVNTPGSIGGTYGGGVELGSEQVRINLLIGLSLVAGGFTVGGDVTVSKQDASRLVNKGAEGLKLAKQGTIDAAKAIQEYGVEAAQLVEAGVATPLELAKGGLIDAETAVRDFGVSANTLVQENLLTAETAIEQFGSSALDLAQTGAITAQKATQLGVSAATLLENNVITAEQAIDDFGLSPENLYKQGLITTQQAAEFGYNVSSSLYHAGTNAGTTVYQFFTSPFK